MSNGIATLKDLPAFYNKQRELFEESQKLREELGIAIMKRDQLSSLLTEANRLVYVTRVERDKIEQKILDNKEKYFGDNPKR